MPIEESNIKLRTVNNPPYTTTNTELTFTEADTNVIEMAGAIQALDSGGDVPAFSGSYVVGEYATYAGKLYRCILNTSSSPAAAPASWTLASAGELTHEQNTDTQLYSPANSAAVTADSLYGVAQCGIEHRSVVLSSAQILALNSTPIDVVPAASGKTIMPIVAWTEGDFDSTSPSSTPYATATALVLIHSGADNPIMYNQTALESNIKRRTHFVPFDIASGTPGNTIMLVNRALQVQASVANPTAGDYDIRIHVLYTVITQPYG